jgi:ferredoxin-thioredoxin reductase catalytic subunit
MPRTLEDLISISEAHGWSLNSDDHIVDVILAGQNRLFEKFGQYYCPCKVKHTDDNICPCDDAESEIIREGHCYCSLFWKE